MIVRCNFLSSISNDVAVHPQKKLAQECSFTHVPLSAKVIALNYLKLHMQSKISVSKIYSFLLLKYVNFTNFSFRIKQDEAEL